MCDTAVSLVGDELLFAKNSDRDPNEAQILDWQPAQDHPAGAVVRCTYLDVAQVTHTHATLLSRPWWCWGAEMGTNEHGVTIGNEAVFARTAGSASKSRTGKALLGMDLLRLALERATTAAEAVQVIVSLLEQHGQGGPASRLHPSLRYDNSYLVADRNGATVLETVGRRWATQDVRGPGTSISNALTIPSLAGVHTDALRTSVIRATRRRMTTRHLARRATTPLAMMAMLRADDGPRWRRTNGSMGGPNMHGGGVLANSQTVASWVGAPASGLQWATGTAEPSLSLFKPVRVGEPVDVGRPTDLADGTSLWWRHERLHRASLSDLRAARRVVGRERDETEQRWVESSPSSAEAFSEATALEQRWLDEVVTLRLTAVRPASVRPVWRAEDARAGFSRPLTPDRVEGPR